MILSLSPTFRIYLFLRSGQQTGPRLWEISTPRPSKYWLSIPQDPPTAWRIPVSGALCHSPKDFPLISDIT